MATSSFLAFTLFCFLVFLHASFGQIEQVTSGHTWDQPQPPIQSLQQHRHMYRRECALKRLNTLEPTRRVESEGGETEFWDQSEEQIECAGVSVLRHTIRPRGLLLPHYTNTPKLVYVVQGRGIQGAVFPGCPETFGSGSESQSKSRRERGERLGDDQHQKIRRVHEGDVFGLPAGVAEWIYNGGDSELVLFSVHYTSHGANQLDQNLRSFFLAGNPQEEIQIGGQRQCHGQRGSRERGQHERGQEERGQHERGQEERGQHEQSREEREREERSREKREHHERGQEEKGQHEQSREERSQEERGHHERGQQEKGQHEQSRQEREREERSREKRGHHERGQEEKGQHEQSREEREQEERSREKRGHHERGQEGKGQHEQSREEREREERSREKRGHHERGQEGEGQHEESREEREREERSREKRGHHERGQEGKGQHEQSREKREREERSREKRGQGQEETGQREEGREGKGQHERCQGKRCQQEQGREKREREEREREERSREKRGQGQEETGQREEGREGKGHHERCQGKRCQQEQGREQREREERGRESRGKHERGHDEKGRNERGQQENNGNIFNGFGEEILAEAFNIDTDLARMIQSESKDRRGIIIEVERDLELQIPEFEEEERQESEPEERHREGGRGRANGLEETFCSLRLKHSIGDPSQADIYNPRAGRITTANSLNLPILRYIQLSAERGILHQNAIMAPHWNINAHSLMYVTKGTGRVQVVGENGDSVFDDRVNEGELLVIPQNFAVVKRAGRDGLEWVSIKTIDNAKISQLTGRVSALRGIPAEVLENSYRISREDVNRLKYNREEITVLPPGSRQSHGRD